MGNKNTPDVKTNRAFELRSKYNKEKFGQEATQDKKRDITTPKKPPVPKLDQANTNAMQDHKTRQQHPAAPPNRYVPPTLKDINTLDTPIQAPAARARIDMLKDIASKYRYNPSPVKTTQNKQHNSTQPELTIQEILAEALKNRDYVDKLYQPIQQQEDTLMVSAQSSNRSTLNTEPTVLDAINSSTQSAKNQNANDTSRQTTRIPQPIESPKESPKESQQKGSAHEWRQKALAELDALEAQVASLATKRKVRTQQNQTNADDDTKFRLVILEEGADLPKKIVKIEKWNILTPEDIDKRMHKMQQIQEKKGTKPAAQLSGASKKTRSKNPPRWR